MTGPIKCCYKCVPPKRHLACHDTCPEYIAERKEYDKGKTVRDKEQEQVTYIYESRFSKRNINRLKRKHIYIKER